MKTVPKRDMRRALRHLRQADPVMEGIIGRVVGRVGPIEMMLRRGRFLTLVRSIIGQQISTSAARSINERVRRAVRPRWVTPDSLAELSDKDLRSLGVSPQKIGYLRDLADAVVSRRVRLDRIHRLDDEGVIEELVQVRGIGRWTAQMFLIFCLGRLDVFAPLDLGIRTGIEREYGMSGLPETAVCERMAEAWAPYRSVACLYLWRSGDLEL